MRAVTDATGAVVERTTYRPYGEEVRLSQPLTLAETKGFIGERYDDGSGLQYLNARYYDPRLGMFVQPDWWEVTRPGVGTNRYSYSFNDPVNGRDPGGNASEKPGLFDKGGFFDRVFGGDNRRQDTDGNGRNDWADYQIAAGNAGGGLNFDRFREMRGIDLRSGFNAGAERFGISGEPTDIRDSVYVNRRLGLKVINGVLVGAVGFKCSAGGSFCGKFLAAAIGVNGTYGIDVAFSLDVDGLISVVKGFGLFGGGLWESVHQRITVSDGITTGRFFDYTVRHEIGHMFGLGHQPNGTKSLMSYSANKSGQFNSNEIERLINAYQ